MFLTIPTADFRNQWVGFTLTDSDGNIFYADIVRLCELTTLDGVEFPPGGPVVYLTVIDTDTDRMKIANRMLPKFQQRVVDIVQSWSHGNKKHGYPVICIETGEHWSSVKACSDAHKLSYSQLINHLKGMVGYRTVKGRTYKKAG